MFGAARATVSTGRWPSTPIAAISVEIGGGERQQKAHSPAEATANVVPPPPPPPIGQCLVLPSTVREPVGSPQCEVFGWFSQWPPRGPVERVSRPRSNFVPAGRLTRPCPCRPLLLLTHIGHSVPETRRLGDESILPRLPKGEDENPHQYVIDFFFFSSGSGQLPRSRPFFGVGEVVLGNWTPAVRSDLLAGLVSVCPGDRWR